MQTTLELPGNPADQLALLAFQSVVPVEGPCQLSVQVASAAAEVADISANEPARPSDPIPTTAVTASLCTMRTSMSTAFSVPIVQRLDPVEALPGTSWRLAARTPH